MSQQPPLPTRINTSDVDINGVTYRLVAFYFPGSETGWDKYYDAAFLGNFYVLPAPVTLTVKGITASFHTAEAAFQATKWWGVDAVRNDLANAPDGKAAFNIKSAAEISHPDWDHSYGGMGKDAAMRTILALKFATPALEDALMLTGDAYLLEHKWKRGTDSYWSDGYDGNGTNMLGQALMEIRATKKNGKGNPIKPGTHYSVKDFTNGVMAADS